MSTEDPKRTGWLRQRIGWDDLRATLEAHRAPRKSFMFYLGGITLFLFLIQVASGILLLVHYRPDATLAFASVERISGEIPYGDLIRGVHTWASDLFVASLLAHMFSILARRSYKPPHELAWLSGQAALVIGVGLAFTGMILPWSQKAYTQARMGSEMARFVPIIGDGLKHFMRGDEEVSPNTLVHAFGFHVAVLPAALTLLAAAHLFLLYRTPAAAPKGADDAATMPLFPDFFIRQGVALTGLIVVLMTLAIFADRPLGEAADARLPSVGAHPPWYFLPFHQLIRSAPRELLGVDGPRFLVGAACGLGLVVVALPFLDPRGSKVTAWAAWISLIILCLLATSALT
ncbi:MAG: cytochrome b N-terminal domain-containing protein [Byssovorax sp.]